MASNTLSDARHFGTTRVASSGSGRLARRLVVIGLVAGLSAAFGVQATRIWLAHNVHTVVPGQVYRSGQLDPDELERTVRAYGVRTVVNLRGRGDPAPWYVNESRK